MLKLFMKTLKKKIKGKQKKTALKAVPIPKNMNLKLIDKQNRKALCEGRSQGFGGGFATLNEETGVVETVMPLTACADFYAEIIHTEATGKEWSVFGLNYKKQDIFKKADFGYLVCGILENNHGGKYAGYDKEVEALETNYKHIQTLINWFEDKLGVKFKTEITRIEKNRFLFKFDLFWTKGTYLISVYKFLSRAPIFYDGKEDIIKFFDAMKDGECYAWKAIKPKIMDMLAGNVPEQKMTAQDSRPHNLGIQTFKWPKELKA